MQVLDRNSMYSYQVNLERFKHRSVILVRSRMEMTVSRSVWSVLCIISHLWKIVRSIVGGSHLTLIE